MNNTPYPDINIKLDDKRYALKNLKLLGHGVERCAFVDPRDDKKVIKLSFDEKTKQTKKEIAYLSYLKKKQIPFIHIPEYYGCFKSKDYIGISQELICNNDGTKPIFFSDYYKENPKHAETLLVELFAFLYKYNVLVADLTPSVNILVVKKKTTTALVVIDGLYCKPRIPLTKWFKYCGRKSIRKSFYKHLMCLNLNLDEIWEKVKKLASKKSAQQSKKSL